MLSPASAVLLFSLLNTDPVASYSMQKTAKDDFSQIAQEKSLTGKENVAPQPPVEAVRIKWGRTTDPNNDPDHFVPQPLTEHDAIAEGWRYIDGGCKNPSNRGRRYVQDEDFTNILIYGGNGNIAGLQLSLPRLDDTTRPLPFIPDASENDTLTVFLTNPENICDVSKYNGESKQNSGLYIQTGPSPGDLMFIPPTEEELIESDLGYSRGKCFPVYMGMHYWRGFTKDMDCNNFWPVFLLFNPSGRLAGFGRGVIAGASSPEWKISSWEHPPYPALGMFMASVPTCLMNRAMSAQHVYLTDDIRSLTC